MKNLPEVLNYDLQCIYTESDTVDGTHQNLTLSRTRFPRGWSYIEKSSYIKVHYG